MENPKDNNSKEEALSIHYNKATILFITLLVVLTTVAYQPILFNFFLGDDFVHLIWLKKAMLDPELILRNFHHNWLDVKTTSFYRPLISVFMALDYSIWKVNALGFHLTNLFFHLVATVSIFFLASGLFENSKNFSEAENKPGLEALGYGFVGALVFGLYPLHSEAVAWITGRVDVIVTAFICLSLLCFKNYRQTKKKLWFSLSLISMVLGLMSKEMAITIPFIFFAYSLIFDPKKAKESNIQKVFSSFKVVSPFLCLLALYFVVRYLSLGTILGGYSNSFLPGGTIRQYLETWIHGIRMFLIPLNRDIIPSSHPLTITWIITLIGSFVILVYNLFTNAIVRRLTLFNLIFLFFAFLPVYKLFAISNDLQGSRLGHVATVAFALLISSSLIVDLKKDGKWKKVLLGSLASLYLILCFNGLWTNNTVWQTAGKESNAIRAGLTKIYKTVENDPQVLLVNLPDNIHGAYVARNALDGMTKSPQFVRDINNCLMVNPLEPIVPFGYLKDSLRKAKDKVKVYNWNNKSRIFEKISIPGEAKPVAREWFPDQMKELFPSLEEYRGSMLARGNQEITLNIKDEPCFDFELLRIWMTNLKPDSKNPRAILYYTNTLNPTPSNQKSIVRDLKLDQSQEIITFPLSSRPDWVLGGKSKSLKLKFTGMKRANLKRADVVLKINTMPTISFENSGYLGTKGYLHLSQKEKEKEIFVNGANIPYTTKTLIVISKPNKFFNHLNATYTEPEILHRIEEKATGLVKIKREMFPSVGIYELRAWCLDMNDRLISLASDHIVVSVDS